MLEKSVFDVMVIGAKRKVEFKVTKLPNEMKMLSYLAGERSNAGTYFSTMANVTYKDRHDFLKSSGEENKRFWKPLPYIKMI